MIVKTAQGEGQGECTLCKKRNRYSRNWMCLLYGVQGKNGLYCGRCIQELCYVEKMLSEIDRQDKWLQEAGYTPYNVDMAFNAIRLALKESVVDE